MQNDHEELIQQLGIGKINHYSICFYFPSVYVTYRHIFFVSMGLLILLHLAWFTMFLKMGYVLVRKGETHDLSEHKSGEDQPTQSSSSSTTKKKKQ